MRSEFPSAGFGGQRFGGQAQNTKNTEKTQKNIKTKHRKTLLFLDRTTGRETRRLQLRQGCNHCSIAKWSFVNISAHAADLYNGTYAEQWCNHSLILLWAFPKPQAPVSVDVQSWALETPIQNVKWAPSAALPIRVTYRRVSKKMLCQKSVEMFLVLFWINNWVILENQFFYCLALAILRRMGRVSTRNLEYGPVFSLLQCFSLFVNVFSMFVCFVLCCFVLTS